MFILQFFTYTFMISYSAYAYGGHSMCMIVAL